MRGKERFSSSSDITGLDWLGLKDHIYGNFDYDGKDPRSLTVLIS